MKPSASLSGLRKKHAEEKKLTKSASSQALSRYKWDMSSPAIPLSKIPSPAERRQRAKYRSQNIAWSADNEGNKGTSKEESTEDEIDRLQPKVFVPYVTKPGHTPRRVAVERKKKEFDSQDISALLQFHGINAEMMEESNPPESNTP